MDCPNLTELVGHRYRVGWEPGYSGRDPWYIQVLCRRGHICPWGPGELAACTNTRHMTNRLAKRPYAQVHQDGDDGGNVVFPVAHLREVAKIMGARRRRVLSEAECQRLAEMGEATRFSSRSHGVKSAQNASESLPVPLDVSEHLEAPSRR